MDNHIIQTCRVFANRKEYYDYDIISAVRTYSDIVSHSLCSVRSEILKAIRIKYASRFFYLLRFTDVLKRIFPSLDKCYDHPHGKRRFENIFEHQMLVGDSISPRFPLVKLAGYLHDVGKVLVAKGDNFTDHDKLGAKRLREELFAIGFTSDECKRISDLVRYHMCVVRSDMSERKAQKILNKLRVNDVSYIDFLRLKVADRNSNLCRTPLSIAEIRKIVSLFQKQESLYQNSEKLTIADLAINGDVVMKTLRIGPSRFVGEILERLLQTVVVNPSLNTSEGLRNVLLTVIKPMFLV